MGKKPPFAKGRNRCIFCGEFDVSREHIFPAWLQKIIDPIHKSYSVHMVEFAAIDSETNERQSVWKNGRLQRPGDILTQKLRCVCQKCNNEWMSQLQMAAMEPLTKVVDGSWQSLTSAEARILASWLTMFVMVYETADSFTAASDETDRRHFWRTRVPPLGWAMFVGSFEGTHYNPAVYHWGIRLLDGPSAHFSEQCNTQGTTVAIGKAIFHIFSSRVLDAWARFNPNQFSKHHDIGLIHPSDNLPILRPKHCWNDNGFEYLHAAIQNQVKATYVGRK